MRMWMISPPSTMCRKHLLGEHGELHKHRHNFVKHHKISGRIFPVVQIEPESMKTRHDELAAEMLRRGYNHQSEYEQPDLSYLEDELRFAKVNVHQSLYELHKRCPDCKDRYYSQTPFGNVILEIMETI